MELSEKYRPKEIEEVIGQDAIIESIKARDKPKHYLFIGPPGCGKTTLALIIAQRFKLPLIEFNASDDRGIGMVRNEIKRHTKIRGERIILLDEADAMTKDAQNAMRRIMEDPLSTSYFILTGNSGWKIIEPIKSRCTVFEFNRIPDWELGTHMLDICKKESIAIDEDAQEGFIELMALAKGDMRKAIKTLEKIVDKENKITKKVVLSFIKPKTTTEALRQAMGGDFEKAKELVENAYSENLCSPEEMAKEFYESIKEVEKKEWRILLYRELANTERALRTDCDPVMPLIQLVGFVAYAWLLPHFPDSMKEL